MPGQTWRDNGHKALMPVISCASSDGPITGAALGAGVDCRPTARMRKAGLGCVAGTCIFVHANTPGDGKRISTSRQVQTQTDGQLTTWSRVPEAPHARPVVLPARGARAGLRSLRGGPTEGSTARAIDLWPRHQRRWAMAL